MKIGKKWNVCSNLPNDDSQILEFSNIEAISNIKSSTNRVGQSRVK